MEDEFILKQASNWEWPHKPHRPVRLWSHAYGVLGTHSIYAQIVEWDDLTLDVLTRHLSLAVLTQGKKPKR